MRIWVWAISGLMVAAAALVTPPRAAACTCVASPFYRSNPSDGDIGHALNEAIFIEGVFAASSIRLEDESGKPVEFGLNAGPWPGCPGTSADVIPKAPLAPNTRYTIRVDPLYPQALDPSESASLRFTTGSEMLPDPALDPPTRAKASIVFDAPEPMCGGGKVYTCLGIGETKDIELIIRRGQEVLMRSTTLVQDDGMYVVPSVPDCVELRRRAPTGKRSAPLTICGDALNARPWVAGDTERQVVQCQGGVIGRAANAPDVGAPLPAGSGVLEAGSRSQADARAQAGSKSEAGSRAQAGSRSEENLLPSAAQDDEHRTYGCAAASSGDVGGAGTFALLLFSLAARRPLSRRRHAPRDGNAGPPGPSAPPSTYSSARR